MEKVMADKWVSKSVEMMVVLTVDMMVYLMD
jgi:hypothetical protein